MAETTYEINVAFEGKHDFTVTVDRNGPDNTTIHHARFVKFALEKALVGDYQVSMTRTTKETSMEEIQ